MPWALPQKAASLVFVVHQKLLKPTGTLSSHDGEGGSGGGIGGAEGGRGSHKPQVCMHCFSFAAL